MDQLFGHWLVVKAEGVKELEGSLLELSNLGEVRWKLNTGGAASANPSGDVPLTKSSMPLLRCDTFELVTRDCRGHFLEQFYMRFGTYRGHILDCEIDYIDIDTVSDAVSELVVRKDLWVLGCRKVDAPQVKQSTEPPFSFLPALEDGYFSDLDIVAANGRTFKTHICVLKLSASDLDWESKPPPLSGLPEEVLGTALHYVYGQCLPADLSEQTAEQVSALMEDWPQLRSLQQMCKAYLSHVTLNNRILELLADVDAYATRMAASFQALKVRFEAGEWCDVVQRSAGDAAVIVAKAVLLAQIYHQNRLKAKAVLLILSYHQNSARSANLIENPNPGLYRPLPARVRRVTVLGACRTLAMEKWEVFGLGSFDEKHNSIVEEGLSIFREDLSQEASRAVIGYVQSRCPVVLSQLKSFLSGLSSVLNGLEAAQRLDLACYLVPELELVLDTAVAILLVVEGLVEALLNQSLKEEESWTQLSPYEQSLNKDLTNKELVRFDCLLEKITAVQEHLIQRKDDFKELSGGNKLRLVVSHLDQLIVELPVFLLRLDDFAGLLNHQFEWDESQFGFRVATAKVCELVRKLVMMRGVIEESMLSLCQVVDRQEFTNAAVELNLLDADVAPKAQPTPHPPQAQPPPQKLNLPSGLCEPPSASKSALSRAAQTLLETKAGTDMVFEVFEVATESVTQFPAHRVIVAARCDWFRRALLSGMREDIQRRIQVHNSSSMLFGVLLRYLYTGTLATSSLSCAQIVDLLVLADCYEVDPLKALCEEALILHIKEESVVELLHMADQVNAHKLKVECVTFICEHRGVLNQESFGELLLTLQAEVYDAVRLRTSYYPRSKRHERRRQCSNPGRCMPK